MKTDSRTLFQIIVDAGFRKQREVIDKAEALGLSLPASTLSSMVRGSPGHPSARKALAKVLGIGEARVVEAIANSAEPSAK